MPIYEYVCEKCQACSKVIQPLGADKLECKCGADMTKVMSSYAFVYMKGKGGYPSFRKRYMGTAPGTSSLTFNGHRTSEHTVSRDPVARREGDKWLESME